MSCLEGAFRISQRRSCLSSPCLDIMCTHRLTAVKPLARSSKCCSSSLLMVCIGHVMCTQQKTDCMYEVLYMSRSYIVFARHLQGVYLNWPLTINVNMQFYMKNKSSNDIQSSPQVTCGEVIRLESSSFLHVSQQLLPLRVFSMQCPGDRGSC